MSRVIRICVAAVSVLALAAACAPEDAATYLRPSATRQRAQRGHFSRQDRPAYPPWFVEDDPTNGKGYESAVAHAVAEKLGFSTSEVTWITVPFTSAYAPGPKKFDVDVNQVSISDARRKAATSPVATTKWPRR